VDGVREKTVGIVSSPPAVSVAERIGEEIDRLRSEKVVPGDIAVLSLRGRAAEGSIIQHAALGGHRVVAADDPAMAEHVVCDTFLRLKGLERPVVIVTDLQGLAGRQGGARMHIALTRALGVVRAVGTRDEITADPLLNRLSRV
jgi:superfamily I DNA and RNA helicase